MQKARNARKDIPGGDICSIHVVLCFHSRHSMMLTLASSFDSGFGILDSANSNKIATGISTQEHQLCMNYTHTHCTLHTHARTNDMHLRHCCTLCIYDTCISASYKVLILAYLLPTTMRALPKPCCTMLWYKTQMVYPCLSFP